MRRSIVLFAGLLATILVVGSLPAAAYVDVGHDPDDSGSSYDIRSTVRGVQRGEHARRLRLVVDTYDEVFWPGSYVMIDVRLDARGGRAADATLHMWMMDMSGSGCELTKRSGPLLGRGRFRVLDATTVVCRVRVHPLHPTKTIRWKVVTRNPDTTRNAYDVAPNHGMYG